MQQRGTLIVGQKFGLVRPVGQEEKGHDRHDDGDDALEDENPSPGTVTAYTVHMSYGICQELERHLNQ